MLKFLMDDRDRQRKTSENGTTELKKQPEHKGRQKAKTQDPNKAPKETKPKKLFPNSVLFKTWGENLSENEQKEAEALFQKYGYNAFLSDRLPLDRPLPDTRDPRYILLPPTFNRSHRHCLQSNTTFSYFPPMTWNVFTDRQGEDETVLTSFLFWIGVWRRNTQRTCRASPWCSSTWTKPSRSSKEPCTASSAAPPNTCWRRLSWWTTTAQMVRCCFELSRFVGGQNS